MSMYFFKVLRHMLRSLVQNCLINEITKIEFCFRNKKYICSFKYRNIHQSQVQDYLRHSQYKVRTLIIVKKQTNLIHVIFMIEMDLIVIKNSVVNLGGNSGGQLTHTQLIFTAQIWPLFKHQI